MSLFIPPNVRATDANGLPLPGATLTFYLTGTLTKTDVFTTSSLGTAHANPVVADAGGLFASIYLDPAITYRAILKDALGNTVDDVDPYDFSGSGSTAASRTILADITTPAVGDVRTLTESGREGTFVFSSANLSASVTADQLQGVYVPPSSDTTGASGAWVRKFNGPPVITAPMFGALGGYDTITAAHAGTDDTTPIQALLNFWKSNPSYIPDFQGRYWTVSSEITIQQTSGFAVEQNAPALRAGTFVAKTGSSGTRLVTVNAPGCNIHGKLGAIGCGDPAGNCISYANRSWDFGIYLVDSSTIRMPDGWYAGNFKCWGFDASTENFANLGNRSNNLGSNIGARVGPGHAFNCGSSAGQTNASRLQYTISTIAFSGSTGSVVQTTTVGFTTALDPKIAAGDIFTYTEASGKRTAYTISSIDFVGNTITFYFWLPSTAAAGNTMDSAHGGFLHIHGSNSGEGRYGPVEGIRAGVGCKDSGLYGSHVGSVHVEASGICHVTGSPPNGACYGGSTEGLHCESTYLLHSHRGITPMGRDIGTISASGAGLQPSQAGFLAQFYHQRPRWTSDQLNNYGTAGISLVDGNGAFVGNEAGPPSYDTPPAAFTVSNRPSERYFLAAYSSVSPPTVTLNWYDEYNEGWGGKNWMGFELQGAAAGRNALSQVTVQLAAALVTAGWTLNGATAAIVYPPMRGPCRGIGIADAKNKNIKFNLDPQESAALQGTAINGDAAATLDPSTSRRTQIWNSPFTANRAATLNTTHAVDGDTFRIIRTAAASGAFTLDLGAALKSLTAGQDAEVTYSGALSAWVLTDFGSL